VVVIELQDLANYAGATFQWYKDGVKIPTAQEHIYTALSTGDYKLLVTYGDCSVYSNVLSIVTGSSTYGILEPIVGFIPASMQLCGPMSEVKMFVTNLTDYVDPTFYWYKDNVQIATGASYTTTLEGTYFVIVGDDDCTAKSESYTIIDNGFGHEPVITSVTSYHDLCEGNGVVVIELEDLDDYPSATFQWYKDGVEINGATEHIFVAEFTGNYKLLVIHGDCSVYSNTITVVPGSSPYEITNPIIASTSGSLSLCGPMSELTLYVSNVSDYSNPTFYWYRNNLRVGMGESLTTNIEGDYFVVVGDDDCSSISTTVTIIDEGAGINPIISSVTGSLDLCEGEGVVVLELNDLANYPSAIYQWYKDGIAINGANNHIYIAETIGEYKLLVSYQSCSVYSNSLIVVPGSSPYEITDPIIATIPESGQLCGPMSIVTLFVSNVADYSAPAFYWYKDNIRVGTGAQYITSEVGEYFVVVGDENCSAISETFIVEESGSTLDLNITSLSGSNILCIGGSLILQLEDYENYSGALFQWYKNNVEIPGATNHILKTSAEGNYKLYVIYDECAAYSNTIEVIISPTNNEIEKPILVYTPESGNLCGPMSEVTMTVGNILDYSVPEFAWYKDNVYVGSGASYTATAEGLYFVMVMDGECTAISVAHNVIDNGASFEPVIYSVSGGLTLCENGGKLLLELEDYDMYQGALLQWYKDNVIIQGATNYTYKVELPGNYKVRVLYESCSVYSNTLTVTEDSGSSIDVPQLTFVPEFGQLCGPYSTVTIAVENINSYNNPEFYWYYNNTYYSNGSIITISQVGEYYVVVSDGGCTSVSDTHVVDDSGYSIENPIVTSLPSSNVICGDNGSVILRLINAHSYYYPELQWYKDGMPIAGATTYFYAASEAGTYKLLVVDDPCSIFSPEFVITESESGIETPIISSFPVDAKVYNNNPVEMFLTNIDDYDNPQFYWYSVHQNAIVGDNSISYSTLTLGTYRLMVVDGDCAAWSNDISITIGDCPTVTFDVTDLATCEGETVDLMTAVSNVPSNHQVHFYSDPALQNEIYNIVYNVTSATYFVRSMDHETTCVSEVYTLTLIAAPAPTATVGGTYTAYQGEVINIPVILTGNSPWELTYNVNGFDEQTITVDESPYYISATYSVGTSYLNLVSVSNDYCTGSASGTATIIINSHSTELDAEFGEDATICNGELAKLHVILTGTAPWEIVYSDGHEEFTLRDITTTYYEWAVAPEQSTVYSLVSVKDLHYFRDDFDQNVTITVVDSPNLTIDTQFDVCQSDQSVVVPYTSLQTSLKYKLDFAIEANLVGFVDINEYVDLPQSELNILLPNGIVGGNYLAELYVINETGCENIYPIIIRVFEGPVIITQPENSINMCEGDDLLLSVEAAGIDLTYQWYKDGVAIDGATSNVYYEEYHSELDGYYYVEISGRCSGEENITSYAVVVTINEISMLRKWNNILFVDNSSEQYVQYQWYKNGVAITMDGKSQYLRIATNEDAEYQVRTYYADGSSLLSCPILISADGYVASTLVYPNPVNQNERVTITIDNHDDNIHTIEIVDVAGRTVFVTKTEERELKIPVNMAKGSYIVKITSSSGKSFNNKLIVK
ncbi:T9SS type A sorting domain-containing protein, partial [Bacteroidales bacterium OttesenSCG-928-L14]|nr:T9SS type A sorting domain-containing protein [Bacteroidales bacterium OttesenSCG-928-L14]